MHWSNNRRHTLQEEAREALQLTVYKVAGKRNGSKNSFQIFHEALLSIYQHFWIEFRVQVFTKNCSSFVSGSWFCIILWDTGNVAFGAHSERWHYGTDSVPPWEAQEKEQPAMHSRSINFLNHKPLCLISTVKKFSEVWKISEKTWKLRLQWLLIVKSYAITDPFSDGRSASFNISGILVWIIKICITKTKYSCLNGHHLFATLLLDSFNTLAFQVSSPVCTSLFWISLLKHVLAWIFFHAELHFVIFISYLNELDYVHAAERCQSCQTICFKNEKRSWTS